MNKKTNACRMLDQQKIPYQLREYAWSEDSLDARHVAVETGDAQLTFLKRLY